MQDIFKEYLEDDSQPTRHRALTAKSYKNIDHSLESQDTNCELATYGDALLKVAYCEILFEESVENITEKKKQYEEDKVLVEVIARHYQLLKYIRFDESDKNIPKDYDYRVPKLGKDSPSKYIATAAEALLAAIFLDHDKDMKLIIEIAKHWKALIDCMSKEPQ